MPGGDEEGGYEDGGGADFCLLYGGGDGWGC